MSLPDRMRRIDRLVIVLGVLAIVLFSATATIYLFQDRTWLGGLYVFLVLVNSVALGWYLRQRRRHRDWL